MSYASRRARSDLFLPAMDRIIRATLPDVVAASDELDCKYATDMVFLATPKVNIGCRIREPGFIERGYGREFTMRANLASGRLTEIDKYRRGYCDLLLYAHAASKKGAVIRLWYLLSLAAWRVHDARDRRWQAQGHRSQIVVRTIRNKDGQSSLVVFDIDRFIGDPPLVIASGGDLVTPKENSVAVAVGKSTQTACEHQLSFGFGEMTQHGERKH